MEISVRIKNRDWKSDLTEAAMNTVNKTLDDGRELTPELFRKYLISEHSPVRAVDLRVYLMGIPYASSVHFVRHKIGIEPYVSTNRPDRTKKERSINDTVNHIFDTNPQGLINMARKRLCVGKVAKETYDIMADLKYYLMCHKDIYMNVFGQCLVPDCIYRGGGCPEFKSCGFVDYVVLSGAESIADKYSDYNAIFMQRMSMGGEK